MRRVGLSLVVIAVVVALAGCAARPASQDGDQGGTEEPTAPCLLASLPEPSSTVDRVQDVRLEFDRNVKAARVIAFAWSRLASPELEGQALVWELGANRPASQWQVVVVGHVGFGEGQSMALRHNWSFTLDPPTPTYKLRFGRPAPASITSESDTCFVVVSSEPAQLYLEPREGEVVQQLPAGTMLQSVAATDGYLRVRAVDADSTPLFEQPLDGRPYPKPDGELWVKEDDVLPLIVPWWEGFAISSTVDPPTLVVADLQEAYAIQYAINPEADAADLQTAVAYAKFLAMARGLGRLLVPATTEYAEPEDVEYLVDTVSEWFDERLAEVGGETWPPEVTDYRQQATTIGHRWKTASTAFLRLLHPAQKDVALEDLSALLTSAGASLPDDSASFEDWGDAVRRSLNDAVTAVQRAIIEEMSPGLIPLSELGE